MTNTSKDEQVEILFKAATPELINNIVSMVSERFADKPDSSMTSMLAHRLLLIECMEQQIAIVDIFQMNEAVRMIMAKTGNLHEGGHFNVGELRKRLEHLPEGMPVVIDYLKDQEWQHETVLWEKTKINAIYHAEIPEEEKQFVEEIDGELHYSMFTKAVHAFSATPTVDSNGKRLLLIHAHY